MFGVLANYRAVINRTTQIRNYAARKGTRLKALKKKKTTEKKDKEPQSFLSRIEARQRKASPIKFSKLGSAVKDEPFDDVYFMPYYKHSTFTVKNAVELHKETHDPTVYNQPDAFVFARVELNMSLYKKKNKCLDVFKSMIYYPHHVHYANPFKVVAICQRPEEQEAARAAGAHLVTDLDFVQQLQSGEISSEFDYCVTTPDILSQLVPIRGILNRRFPSAQKGSVDFDVGKMVSKFAHSIEYKVQNNLDDLSYAMIETPVGKLTTPTDHIEENLTALLSNVCAHKSVNIGPPIIRIVFLTCPPTKERFMLDHHKYMPAQLIEDDDEHEHDSDDERASNKRSY